MIKNMAFWLENIDTMRAQALRPYITNIPNVHSSVELASCQLKYCATLPVKELPALIEQYRLQGKLAIRKAVREWAKSR